MFVSHCSDMTCVDFRAPVAILSASFCSTSSLDICDLHAEIRIGLLYAIFPLIRALYMFSKESLSAPNFVLVRDFIIFLLFAQFDIRCSI